MAVYGCVGLCMAVYGYVGLCMAISMCMATSIKDIVPNGVTVNMPPFLAGRDQLTALETQETMSIASVRIHVEYMCRGQLVG